MSSEKALYDVIEILWIYLFAIIASPYLLIRALMVSDAEFLAGFESELGLF